MASTIFGATINALAFTGGSYLFRKLDKSGSLKEMKRHDKALEKLQGAREAWYERQVEEKERVEKLRKELNDASADMRETNRALE